MQFDRSVLPTQSDCTAARLGPAAVRLISPRRLMYVKPMRVVYGLTGLTTHDLARAPREIAR